MRYTAYNICERADGWYCPETRRTYKTAVYAIRAVRRRERQDLAGVSVAVITWHPTTRVGRLVASVFAED